VRISRVCPRRGSRPSCQEVWILTNVDADLTKLVVEKDPSAPGRLNVDVTYTVVLGLHQVAFVHRVTI